LSFLTALLPSVRRGLFAVSIASTATQKLQAFFEDPDHLRQQAYNVFLGIRRQGSQHFLHGIQPDSERFTFFSEKISHGTVQNRRYILQTLKPWGYHAVFNTGKGIPAHIKAFRQFRLGHAKPAASAADIAADDCGQALNFSGSHSLHSFLSVKPYLALPADKMDLNPSHLTFHPTRL
jgi:hypothetical protein